jgi:CubicO group peptidase (beta-lactamase class C family)
MSTDDAIRWAVAELLGQPPGTGETLAVVAMRNGAIVAEGYGPGTTADTTLISWSMAKSVTHALIGLLVDDGRIDVAAPAGVPEWRDDERSEITVQQLLNMNSGLTFVEDYVDAGVSNCIEMLFGDGQHDVAAYAAALPLQHAPGSVFNYSSGTTNILSRMAGQLVGGGEEGMRAYLQARLFGPVGMSSALPRFDAAGTFIGSSFVYCTARDFAAFGELYRNDGVANGHRVLSSDWIAHAQRPTPVTEAEAHGYGAHWWLWPEYGAFAAHGYEGQRILVVPERGLTLVRLGKTVAADGPAMERYLRAMIDAAQ